MVEPEKSTPLAKCRQNIHSWGEAVYFQARSTDSKLALGIFLSTYLLIKHGRLSNCREVKERILLSVQKLGV